jgi:FkbM family methyltransferase
LLNLVGQLARNSAAPYREDRPDQLLAQPQTHPDAAAFTDARLGLLRAELALLHQALLLQQRRSLPLQHPPANRASAAALAMSQLGQDLWVLERTGYKPGGFFVEFGATDGVLLSNTWLLEQHFGWRGLCAEPNRGFYQQLQVNRTCTVSDACIGGHSGEQVAFVLSDAYGGRLADAHADQHGAKRDAYRDTGQVVTLETVSLDDFLKRHQAPREIDTISIDTEGSEYAILSTFPFEQWNVRLWTIEHNFTERRQDIRRLMEHNGYVCTEAQWDDWYEKAPAPPAPDGGFSSARP